MHPRSSSRTHRGDLGQAPGRPARYRTIFLSDLHLGTRGCQADLILDFLRHNDADTVYLVGDIVDGWRLTSRLVLAAVA